MPYVTDLSLRHEVAEDAIVAACAPETVLVVDNSENNFSFVADLLFNIHYRKNLESKIPDFARLAIFSGFELGHKPHCFFDIGEDYITLEDWRRFAAQGNGCDVCRAAIAQCVNRQVGFSSYGLFDELDDTVAMVARGDGRQESTAARLMAHQARGWMGGGSSSYEFLDPVLIVFDIMRFQHLPTDEQERMLRDLAPAVMWARCTKNVYTKVCVSQRWGDFFEHALQDAGKRFGVYVADWRVVRFQRDPQADEKKLADLFGCFGRMYAPGVMLFGRPAGCDNAGDPDYVVASHKESGVSAVFSFEPLPPLPEGEKRPSWHSGIQEVVVPYTGDADKDLCALRKALDAFCANVGDRSTKNRNMEAFLREAEERWQEYRRTGLHLTLDEVFAWMDSWGTDYEPPPPAAHL